MTRASVVSLLLALLLLGVVLELVRRRRLQERYALLWLLTGSVILLLAAWPSALGRISSLMGIAYPPTALFVLAGAFVLVVILHYSTVISRLAEQNLRLAQHVALLEAKVAAVAQRTEADAHRAAVVEREVVSDVPLFERSGRVTPAGRG